MQTTNKKEDQITFINEKIDLLTKLFHQTLINFRDTLKLYVNENLLSSKSIQQLFKAELDDNRELIKEYQGQFGYLKRDSSYFNEQEHISNNANQQLQKVFELAKNKFLEFNQLILKIFKDSSLEAYSKAITNHQARDRSIVQMEQSHQVSIYQDRWEISENGLHGWGCVLIESQLNFQQSRIVFLKVTKVINLFIQICNLKVLRKKYPTLQSTYNLDCGAFSHYNHGTIWGTDSYGSGQVNSFTFAVGDILKLYWNGPSKTFTTVKKSTGEKYLNLKLVPEQMQRFILEFVCVGYIIVWKLFELSVHIYKLTFKIYNVYGGFHIFIIFIYINQEYYFCSDRALFYSQFLSYPSLKIQSIFQRHYILL